MAMELSSYRLYLCYLATRFSSRSGWCSCLLDNSYSLSKENGTAHGYFVLYYSGWFYDMKVFKFVLPFDSDKDISDLNLGCHSRRRHAVFLMISLRCINSIWIKFRYVNVENNQRMERSGQCSYLFCGYSISRSTKWILQILQRCCRR